MILRRERMLGSVFIAAGLVVQLGWYSLLWTALIRNPALKMMDFVIFYTAGRIAREGGFSQIYSLAAQYQLQQSLVGYEFVPGGVLPFNHPPLLTPLLAWLCNQDYGASYMRWGLFLALLDGGCSMIVARILQQLSWRRRDYILAAAASFLFYPVFISFLKGQDSLVVLLGLLLWAWALLQQRDWAAGLALSLTTLRPQLALLLAVPFIFSRRKVWWGFCLGACGLAVFSVALIGRTGVQDYLTLLQLTARGEGYGINQVGMFNLTGLLLRTLPTLASNAVHVIAWGMFVLTGIILTVLWQQAWSVETLVGISVPLSLFAAPHLHYHDLSYLLLPGLCLALQLVERWHWKPLGSIGALVAASLVLLWGDWGSLKYSVSYLLMLILILGLARPKLYAANA